MGAGVRNPRARITSATPVLWSEEVSGRCPTRHNGTRIALPWHAMNMQPQYRGREAQQPSDIPARGWWDILWRVSKRFGPDNVSLVAGGLAMYALLSVFPALAAAVSLYALVATPADVARQLQGFAGVLPPGVWDIFST